MHPSFLKCRICKKDLRTPVRRCGTYLTHMFCEECINRENNICTICQNTVIMTRDAYMETFLKILKAKCENENCRVELFSQTDQLEHERICKLDHHAHHECEFDKLYRPTTPCTWIGAYHEIEEHFNTHIDTSLIKNPNLIEIKINTNNKYIQLLKAHNQLFWYKHMVIGERIFFLVQAVNYDENNMFEFKIKFISLVGASKTLKENCYDVEVSLNSYFQAGRLLYTDFEHLRPFIQNNIVYTNLEIRHKRKLPDINHNRTNRNHSPTRGSNSHDGSTIEEQKGMQFVKNVLMFGLCCEKCITRKYTKCKICQNTVNTNDVAVEAILKSRIYTCKNENCRAELSLAEKLDHERNCKFGGRRGRYKCEFNEFSKPTIPCKWIGPYNEIEQHFCHHVPPLGTNQIKIKLNTNNKYIQLIKAADNQLFWYKHVVNIQTQTVSFLMQAINYYDERLYKFEYKIKFISLVALNKTQKLLPQRVLKEKCYNAGEDTDANFPTGRCLQSGFDNLRPFIHDEVVYMKLEVYETCERRVYEGCQKRQSVQVSVRDDKCCLIL